MTRQGIARMLALLLLLAGIRAAAQEQVDLKKFYEVKLVKEEVYAYRDLRFVGDYTTWQSPAGNLVLGRTEVGVTLAIVLGEGMVTFEAAEPARAKCEQVFAGHPVMAKFTTLYMRLNPKEYEETLGKAQLTRTGDEAVLKQAQEIYDVKFLGSFHAGALAIIPPEKTRFMDFTTVEFGQVQSQEGYWVSLRRLSPYGSVYPPNYVNKKK
jgi:hypothetical protein